MKTTFIAVLLIICVFVLSCSLTGPSKDGGETGNGSDTTGGTESGDQAGGGGSIQFKNAEGEFSFNPVSAFVPHNRGGHSIQILNFPVDMGSSFDFEKVKLTKDGQYRVDVIIIKESTTNLRPVVVGEYTPHGEDDQARDNVRMVNVYKYADGKETSWQFSRSQMKGVVKITSVDDKEVKGSIDLTADKLALKGGFVAKVVTPY